MGVYKSKYQLPVDIKHMWGVAAMKNYVIVGGGVAGVSAAASIRKLDKTGNITIFTDEHYPFYSRIRLPQLIAGEVSPNRLVIYKANWYAENGIKLKLGDPIKDIDPKNKQLTSIKGENYPYDYLLLTTGSHPFIPPISGIKKEGVFSLRSIKDAFKIREHAIASDKAIVIGGGLLGLEAGNGLRKAGPVVSIIEFFPRLLPRQIDIPGAVILKRQMMEMGFSFYMGVQPREILGKERVTGVLLSDGRKIEGDMVLISAGVRPNLELAKKIGLQTSRGVVVDNRMQTSEDCIFAAGDLVEHRGILYGLWPASQRQGEVAGINMAGGDEVYRGTVSSNVLKVVGINLVSAGEVDVSGKFNSLIRKDIGKYIYRKLVIKDNVIIGCILLGNIKGKREILAAIDQKKVVSEYDAKRLRDGFALGSFYDKQTLAKRPPGEIRII